MSSEIKFETAELSNTGVYWFSNKEVIANKPNSLIVQEAHQVWNLDKFQTIRKPVIVDNISIPTTQDNLRILDMPVKFPGSNEYRLPKEVLPFLDIIKTIAKFEHNVCDNELGSALEYFAYLTIDQGYISKGVTQRREGCHVDGFQGARIETKTKVNRSYTVSNVEPTEFFIQPFQTNHLDDKVHNFFLDFDEQANEEFLWRPEPNQIVLMDAYTVHRAPVMKENAKRVFLRLSYDVKEFDRKGNTHNPMFDYHWNMVARDIQNTLVKYAN